MTPALFLVLVAVAATVIAGVHFARMRDTITDAALAVGMVSLAIVTGSAAPFI